MALSRRTLDSYGSLPPSYANGQYHDAAGNVIPEDDLGATTQPVGQPPADQIPNPEPADTGYGGGSAPPTVKLGHSGGPEDGDWGTDYSTHPEQRPTTSPVGQPPQIGPNGHVIGPWGTDLYPEGTRFNAAGQPIGYGNENWDAPALPGSTLPNPEPLDPAYHHGGDPSPLQRPTTLPVGSMPYTSIPYNPEPTSPGPDYHLDGGRRRIPYAGAPLRPFSRSGRRRLA